LKFLAKKTNINYLIKCFSQFYRHNIISQMSTYPVQRLLLSRVKTKVNDLYFTNMYAWHSH